MKSSPKTGSQSKKSELTDELLKFATTMEGKLIVEKAAQEARTQTPNVSNKDSPEHGNPTEPENRKRTLAISNSFISLMYRDLYKVVY